MSSSEGEHVEKRAVAKKIKRTLQDSDEIGKKKPSAHKLPPEYFEREREHYAKRTRSISHGK